MYRNEYLISDAQLATLAKEYITGVTAADKAKSNYLRVLVAHSQAAASTVKRMTIDKSREIVQNVHDRLYAVVLEAVTTGDIAPDTTLPQEEQTRRSLERNRRTNFARSAKSTLDAWLASGGKLKELKPEEVTKEGLRSGFAPTDRPGPERLVRSADRTLRRLERLATELVSVDKEALKRIYEEIMEKIGPLVAEPMITPRRSVRRGEITLHPSH